MLIYKVKQYLDKGDMILFYECKYRRRIRFKKQPKYKNTNFNFMKYYVFKNKESKGE